MANTEAQPAPTTINLLRCPFCGGQGAFGTTKYSQCTVRQYGWDQDTFHSVNCTSCGTCNLGNVGHASQVDAAHHWNCRV